MNRAVIYARYSDEKQSDQSIEGQIRVCKEYALRNNLDVVDIYVDKAMTGTNDNRPDFMRMIKDSYKNRFDYVIVYRIDRFARDKYDSAIHNMTLKKNGVKRLSAMENISDGPEGVLMESILEGMAQYYSMELAQKVKRGIVDNLKKGKSIGGSDTLGYDVINNKYEINTKESLIVNAIFDLYIELKNTKSVVNLLSDRGLTDKKDRSINQNRVYRALHNEKYTGVYSLGDVTYNDIYPPIITKDKFDIVKSILHKNDRSPRSNAVDSPYHLVGKLYCGYCNHPMLADSSNKPNKKYHYYSCKKNKNHECTQKPLSKEYIESLVVYILLEKILTKDVLDPIIDNAISVYNDGVTDKSTILKLEKEKGKSEKELSNIISVIKKGICSTALENELIQIESKISAISRQIEIEKVRNSAPIDRLDMEIMFSNFVNKAQDSQSFDVLLDAFIHSIIYTNEYIIITLNTDVNNTYKISLNEIKSSILSSNGAPLKHKSNYTIYKGYLIIKVTI